MQRAPTCENCKRNYELRDCRPAGNRIPLLLPCGHTFCEGCILKATKSKTEVTCFNCEEKVLLDVKGEAGVKTILPNIYLLGLLLYNRRIAGDKITGGAVSTFNGIGNIVYKSNSSVVASTATYKEDGSPTKEEPESSVLCDECSLSPASCQCSSCDDCKFCDKCFQQVHKASKLLMKHKPLPLECTGGEKMTCSLHNGRNLEFYDQIVGEAVCAMCIISERCRGHDVILLSDLSSDSEGELTAAVEKAGETLSWWQHSSRVLTKALPEEYMEANQLFADIQSKFTACHTMLLKRQMEMMSEASQKLLTTGSISETLQQLSDKSKSLTVLLKDVSMIMKDKGVLQLKSEEFLKKLQVYTDEDCIAQKVPRTDDNCIRLEFDDASVTSIENLGKLEHRTTDRFNFVKSSDLSDETKEQLKSGSLINEEVPSEEIKMNDIILEEDLDTKLKKFSLLTGYNELVCVTDVTNPTDFKVQRVADKDRLQVLMTDLNKYCRYSNTSNSLIYSIEEGQLVCAQFLSDNNWYRARITNKMNAARPDVIPSWSNGLGVEVLYIDYGNAEELPLTRLRLLPKEFLEVPEMAVTCMLTDIVPPCKSEEWPERSKKAFASLTGDRPMLMNIRKRVGCRLHVDLRKPDDDEPTRDDDRPVSVRDALVFLEVAAFLSPASFPNSDLHEPLRKYKPHEPFTENEFIDVIVTHIEHPEAIYIQKLNSTIHDEQSRLGLVYNSKNKKGWMIDYPHRSLVCAAKFSADKTWYRAQVLNVNVDDTVEVEYVDYGNRENVHFNNLRKLPDMYLDLSRQCLKVKLHGMEKAEDEETWSNESKEFLHKFFLGKPLVAVIKDNQEDICCVEFYDTSTEVDINMNQLVTKFVNNKTNRNTEEEETPSEGVGKEEGGDKDVVEGRESVQLKGVEVTDVDGVLECKPRVPTTEVKVCVTSYLPPAIPTTPRFSATGVHVDEMANIYIHVMDSENSYLTDIMQQLNTNNKQHKKRIKSTEILQPLQAVIGKFSQDSLWYRVEVINIIDEKKLEVRFVDFGNCEETDVASICAEPMFLEIPGQCICVQLADVKPVGGKWSAEAIALLREYIVSEEVGVDFKKGGGRLSEEAFIYVENGSNINKMLIKEKFVTVATECGKAADINNVESDVATSETPAVAASAVGDVECQSGVYSGQPLPKVGVKFDVTVTQVNQPDVIYIQRVSCEDEGGYYGDYDNDDTVREAASHLEELEIMSENINGEGFFSEEEGLGTKPVVGMSCIGKYTSDNLYYRATIERVDEEEGVVEVTYVDFGTTDITPIQNLKTLPPRLALLPMQATKVRLADIKPFENTTSNTKEMLNSTDWSIEVMKHFYALVADKRLIAEIVESNCDTPCIHLYERKEEDGAVVDVSIAEIMQKENMAVHLT